MQGSDAIANCSTRLQALRQTSNTASLNLVSTFMTVTSAVACLLRFDIVNVRIFFVLYRSVRRQHKRSERVGREAAHHSLPCVCHCTDSTTRGPLLNPM